MFDLQHHSFLHKQCKQLLDVAVADTVAAAFLDGLVKGFLQFFFLFFQEKFSVGRGNVSSLAVDGDSEAFLLQGIIGLLSPSGR